jgi:hypothetical protein
MTPGNLPSSQLFHMLDADFRRAWDALAADCDEALRDADRAAGGNFMFARTRWVSSGWLAESQHSYRQPC